ncbi:MAG: PEP-CTERM/exosortase system-associated acyltransferase [bacterium]|nr:PEP-CTERM/exosortase system-associated acyltransferase [bacterium]
MKFLRNDDSDLFSSREARLAAIKNAAPRTELFQGVANTAALDSIFKLRFDVYCKEKNFLPAVDYPECIEYDEYDARAAHIACYSPDDIILGCVRLVTPTTGQDFPFQLHCATFPDFIAPLRAEAVEISRLMLNKVRRNRQKDSFLGVPADLIGDIDGVIPRQKTTLQLQNSRLAGNQLLLLSMFRAMYQHCKVNGIRYWYASMELPLARQLAGMGFRFTPIGPEASYYGIVTPFIADILFLEEEMQKNSWELWQWFSTVLEIPTLQDEYDEMLA